MLRRLLTLVLGATLATGVLIACSSGADADSETIEACERWEQLRARPLDASAIGELREIAELSADPEVSQEARAVALRLELDFSATPGASARVARLDAACDEILATA